MVTTTPATTATTTDPTATSALAKLSGDYTMFLKLLTSQMTNQDPLNPMDTAQYTQQLVQFSQVEQSIQQSGTLKDILARLSGQDMIEASSLIGRRVSYDGATNGMTATTPAQWSWTTPRPPFALSATITDAAGKTIDTRLLDPDATSFAWDGQLASGARAKDGAYTLSLQALDATGAAIPTTIMGSGVVQSVALHDNALALSINGQPQPATALRDVQATGGG